MLATGSSETRRESESRFPFTLVPQHNLFNTPIVEIKIFYNGIRKISVLSDNPKGVPKKNRQK